MGLWSWSSTGLAGPPDGQETAGTATWRGETGTGEEGRREAETTTEPYTLVLV